MTFLLTELLYYDPYAGEYTPPLSAFFFSSQILFTLANLASISLGLGV